ncbi:MAG: endopeptidase La [Planctomycetes bacterium]|nr:endopeptidase La [Planctomycetota bacterium]
MAEPNEPKDDKEPRDEALADEPTGPEERGDSLPPSESPTEVVAELMAENRDQQDGIEAALVSAGDVPPANLFLLPHDQVVLFPDLVVPLMLRSAFAQRVADQIGVQSAFVGIVLAKKPRDPDGEIDVEAADLCEVGCVARVLRTLKLPDGTPSLVVRGLRRFKVKKFLRTKPLVIARVEYPEETNTSTDATQAMARLVRAELKKILASDSALPDEFKLAAANIDVPRALADFTATYFVRDTDERQKLLETFDVQVRLESLLLTLTREVGLLELGQRIQEQIRSRVDKQQRDFFLREQLKEIQKELGQAKDDKTVAIERIVDKLGGKKLPDVVQARVDEEMERLKLLPLEAPEAGVIRNYLEWVASLPWSTYTTDRIDLDQAESILREGHFGLDEVKTRILEFLAVRKLKPDHKGPILCFVGPPGVGKTSFGRSIADCLNRAFVRISLGGMRDEAEIRGHRRTYIGALPGRIVQGLKTAGSANPVFMLDELDKLGNDFRGDPASALLEVLDPEQNHAFSDHFLELPFDLSRVLFVATANTLSTVPQPLIDRLEIIELSGYTASEKVEIANRYLVPRQVERHGLKKGSVRFTRTGMVALIHGYTREAGVRALEQTIARVCRKTATVAARGRAKSVQLKPADLAKLLGTVRFQEEVPLRPDRPGIAIGLAWTPVGGAALSVEAAMVAGGGKLTITGMLGNVMLESARIALSHVQGLCARDKIQCPDISKVDVHLHVPAGAVPKDGPSAGITLATALTSLFSEQPIRPRTAMTGELTLTGKVLPVGGIRDKILAARRAGMTTVVLPAGNRPQIDELNDEVREGLDFQFVGDFAEVVAFMFPKRPRKPRRRQTAAKEPK